jgi:hypothetical protein
MAEYDHDDLNISNLTETRSRRAPDSDRVGADTAAPLRGTRWPAAAGIAALATIVVMGVAAWKFACRSTRDLLGDKSKDDSP